MSTRLLLLFFRFFPAGRPAKSGIGAGRQYCYRSPKMAATTIFAHRPRHLQAGPFPVCSQSVCRIFYLAYVEADGNYTPNWRPYFSGLTLAGYDQTIAPIGGTASATYNSGYGSFWGDDGLMPAVTSGNYYTFNITEYSKPGDTVNEYMGCWKLPTIRFPLPHLPSLRFQALTDLPM